jgi:hypothetical protein
VAEDARAAARRIVEEVLAAHADTAPTGDRELAADEALHRVTDDVTGTDPLVSVDPRTTTTDATSIADELADRPSRAVARRIVEEVLAAHAAAEREVELPAAAAEAEGPPPPPDAVPVQPVPGRVAVVPGIPADTAASEVPTEPVPATTADDAASIARRIVANVLADAEAHATEVSADHDGGPPPLPDDDPEATVALLAAAEPTEPAAADAAAADRTRALPAAPESDAEAAPEVDVVAADEELPEPTAALPVPDEVAAEEAATDASPDRVAVTGETEDHDAVRPEEPDTTVPLTTDEAAPTAHPEPDAGDTGSTGPSGDGAEGAVATLPPREDASAEMTTPVPVAAPPSRRSHWLLASILGAIGLAVLLPLAVAALRSLVELS